MDRRQMNLEEDLRRFTRDLATEVRSLTLAQQKASFGKKISNMDEFIAENITPVRNDPTRSINKLRLFFESLRNLPRADTQERVNRLLRLFPEVRAPTPRVKADGNFDEPESQGFFKAFEEHFRVTYVARRGLERLLIIEGYAKKSWNKIPFHIRMRELARMARAYRLSLRTKY